MGELVAVAQDDGCEDERGDDTADDRDETLTTRGGAAAARGRGGERCGCAQSAQLPRVMTRDDIIGVPS